MRSATALARDRQGPAGPGGVRLAAKAACASRVVTFRDGRIFGIMAESHLKAGRQDLVPGKPLVYGQSITDGCLGWDDSRALLDTLAEAVRRRRVKAEVEAE